MLKKFINDSTRGKDKKYSVRYSSISCVGDRMYNEDRVISLKDGDNYIFALADGLGGQGNGALAADIVIDSIKESYAYQDYDESYLKSLFETAQSELCKSKENTIYKDMMTTLVILYIGHENIQWGHIGDSRLYYFDDKQIIYHTLDHSVPQALVSANIITPDEIRNHPDRNRLLSAMGCEWSKKQRYNLSDVYKLKGSQYFLICSDGFWERIYEKEMVAELVKSNNPKQWLYSMTTDVEHNKQKKSDNYSAITVWIEEID